MGSYLLPLGHAAPPHVVTGGAGKLSVHSGDEVVLGSLEHSKIGFRQGQQRGGHSLQRGRARTERSPLPFKPAAKLLDPAPRIGILPATPPVPATNAPGCLGLASCPQGGPERRHGRGGQKLERLWGAIPVSRGEKPVPGAPGLEAGPWLYTGPAEMEHYCLC